MGTMKLIDADKIHILGHFDRTNGKVTFAKAVREAIKAAPEVEAIPVSYIQEMVRLARKVGADSHAESLEVLLADWAETKRVPKTNISPCEGCEDYVYGGGCKRDGECVAR